MAALTTQLVFWKSFPIVPVNSLIKIMKQVTATYNFFHSRTRNDSNNRYIDEVPATSIIYVFYLKFFEQKSS